MLLMSMLPARFGELLLTRSLKVLAALLLAFAAERLARWIVRRVVHGLQRQQVQQRLESIRARTPRALLASTDPLPSLRRSQRADAIGAVLGNLSSVVIWLLAGISILQILGMRLGPLLAGAGFIGLAIAVSAQQMVRDFLAGIAMLLEDQYGVGDVIDVGPAAGEVERVGLRTTRLRDVDGTVWHVRNGEIERVGNHSRDWARVLLDVEVARGARARAVRGRAVAAAAAGRPGGLGRRGARPGVDHHPARGQDPPVPARRRRPRVASQDRRGDRRRWHPAPARHGGAGARDGAVASSR
jgi:small-conductance mechanosensitive channel